MFTLDELKLKLRPIILEAGSNADTFAEKSLPIAAQHFEAVDDFDEVADIWNEAVVQLLQENFVLPIVVH